MTSASRPTLTGARTTGRSSSATGAATYLRREGRALAQGAFEALVVHHEPSSMVRRSRNVAMPRPGMGAVRTREMPTTPATFEGQVRDVVEIEHMALPRRQAIDLGPPVSGRALRPGVIGAMWREPGKQPRNPMAPPMLLHRESVHGAVEPGRWALDERAALELAPEAQDRLLERVGRLLIGQPRWRAKSYSAAP